MRTRKKRLDERTFKRRNMRRKRVSSGDFKARLPTAANFLRRERTLYTMLRHVLVVEDYEEEEKN
jgi:hypothetical protein